MNIQAGKMGEKMRKEKTNTNYPQRRFTKKTVIVNN